MFFTKNENGFLLEFFSSLLSLFDLRQRVSTYFEQNFTKTVSNPAENDRVSPAMFPGRPPSHFISSRLC